MNQYKVTFSPSGKTVMVDSDNPPEGLGPPGSLLNIATLGGVDIDSPCAGEGTCSLCCVGIDEGMDKLSPVTDIERDTLESSGADMSRSRLACQAIVKGDVACSVPG